MTDDCAPFDTQRDDLPKGFRASAVAASFKKAGRDDLGLIFSDFPCKLAAMFTQNVFRAAPVAICQEILASGRDVRAVIANSGQANSCTGPQGLANCREIQDLAAKDLGILPDEVLLISTGVIGAQLKMDKWREYLPELTSTLGARDAEGFTRAFMTTDAFPKFAHEDLTLSQGTTCITVMAKGAGMICPNMATMLCVALTDCKLDGKLWQEMFDEAVGKTFNRVSVDGDTSTNDTILGLANGASETFLKREKDKKDFFDALVKLLGKVALMLVKDGEGARRIMKIHVHGAADEAEAEKAARAIGNSQLVKTAIYGGDANWGRIINALGYSGAKFEPSEISMSLCGITRFENGMPVNEEMEEELARRLQADEIEISLRMGRGPGDYDLAASDLGREYVSLNADYRS